MGVRNVWVGVLAALLAACVVWAPGAQGADSLKVGVVDFQRCLAESKMGKKLKVEFKNVITDLKADLSKDESTLKGLREDLDKQGSVLSETAKAEKERDYQQRLMAYNRKMEATQQEVRRKDMELTNKIFEGLQPIVREIGETGGYTLIVEKHEGGILYAPTQVDITEEVIRRYDQAAKE